MAVSQRDHGASHAHGEEQDGVVIKRLDTAQGCDRGHDHGSDPWRSHDSPDQSERQQDQTNSKPIGPH